VKDRIFVDTLFVIALINRRDQYHEQAVHAAKQFDGYDLLITDGVLLEIGNALARSYKSEAVQIIEYVLSSEEVQVVHLTQELLEKALAQYRSHQDKAWGLVDCVSFVVMREAGVSSALTFDRHFEQAGFQVLMREDSGK
jgi:predicted nucleic acid-binding protein